MSVDLRGTVTSAIGTIVSGNITEDSLEQNGLIKYSGDLVLEGIVNVAIGEAFTLQYEMLDSPGVVSIPKKFYVIGSFPDPFGQTTSVSFGCKLTLNADLREPINWSEFDQAQEDSEEISPLIVYPLRASSIAAFCCSRIGITFNYLPLTSRFSIAEFDTSGGYVQVLSDLLLSEGYIGYLNQNDMLVVTSLNQTAVAVPYLTEDDVIQLTEADAGLLPGTSVVVNYSVRRLQAPEDGADEDQKLPYDWSANIGEEQFYNFKCKDRDGKEYTFEASYKNSSYSYSRWDDWDRLIYRATWNQGIMADHVGSYLCEFVGSCGLQTSSESFLNKFIQQPYYDMTIETPIYKHKISRYSPQSKPDDYDEVVSNITEKYESGSKIISSMNFDTKKSSSEFVDPQDLNDGVGIATPQLRKNIRLPSEVTRILRGRDPYLVEKVEEKFSKSSSIRRTSVGYYRPSYYDPILKTEREICRLNGRTSFGQKELNNARETSTLTFNQFIETGTQLRCFFEEEVQVGRTAQAELRSSKNNPDNDDYDPNNGFSIEQQSDIQLISGAAQSTRILELDMPYADDDQIYRSFAGFDGQGRATYNYTSFKGRAQQQSIVFGRLQQRLIFGGKYGMTIQTSPRLLPFRPANRFVLHIGNYAVLYMASGSTFTFDSNGIIVGTEGIYWQPVGGSGADKWLTVSPTTGTLPPIPSSYLFNPSTINTIDNVNA